MSQTICLVQCPDCSGTGNDGLHACRFCLGQRHIAIDRCPNIGHVLTHPDGTPAVPWIDTPFPEVTR
jgi:hypothetical protein